MSQRWHLADKRLRIRKAEFQALGGLSHPRLFRKHDGRSWSYWRLM